MTSISKASFSPERQDEMISLSSMSVKFILTTDSSSKTFKKLFVHNYTSFFYRWRECEYDAVGTISEKEVNELLALVLSFKRDQEYYVDS